MFKLQNETIFVEIYKKMLKMELYILMIFLFVF